ncbi:hypothetical protein HJC23_006566 [Cyclotella cryptica]|uniref:Uncharacterized protein n=1 Tax=Cyclotella cryptica TaxID=29204 RepID=A0ABD3PKC5_9STRA
MSELQAILARRRQLNHDDGGASPPRPRQAKQQDPPSDDHDGNDVDAAPHKAASQPTNAAAATATTPFPRPQQTATAGSPGTTDLQEKIRERRLKAMQTYGKHVKNDFKNATQNHHEEAHGAASSNTAGTNSYTRQQSVPPRKSTFFPRSTPHVAPAKSPAESAKGRQDRVVHSPGRSSDASGSVDRRAGLNAENAKWSVKPTVLPSASTGHNARTPSSPVALPTRTQPQPSPSPPQPPLPKTIDDEPPKSPSMLDFMAERYKEEKMKRHPPTTEPQPPHSADATTATTTKSSSSSQQQEKEKSSIPTYYRPGMRPPSSTTTSHYSSTTPSRHGWIPPPPTPTPSPSPSPHPRPIFLPSTNQPLLPPRPIVPPSRPFSSKQRKRTERHHRYHNRSHPSPPRMTLLPPKRVWWMDRSFPKVVLRLVIIGTMFRNL